MRSRFRSDFSHQSQAPQTAQRPTDVRRDIADFLNTFSSVRDHKWLCARTGTFPRVNSIKHSAGLRSQTSRPPDTIQQASKEKQKMPQSDLTEKTFIWIKACEIEIGFDDALYALLLQVVSSCFSRPRRLVILITASLHLDSLCLMIYFS